MGCVSIACLFHGLFLFCARLAVTSMVQRLGSDWQLAPVSSEPSLASSCCHEVNSVGASCAALLQFLLKSFICYLPVQLLPGVEG